MNETVPLSTLTDELWERGELYAKLDSLQEKIRNQIYNTKADKVCILSSRQIGKSFLACILALEHCLREPGSTVRIVSATLKQVSDIVNDNLTKILQDAPHGLIERQKAEYRWRVGQSTLRVGSLERAHVDNNRGGNATLIITEEGGFVPSEDFSYAMDSVLGPQLLRSGGREIHISTPSEDEFHVLHTDIATSCAVAGTFFKYTVFDSPSITAEQITKAADRCGGEDTEAFKREYLAEVIRSTSLMVLPEFNEAEHVREFALPDHYNPLLCLDMGGVRDKTGIITTVYDFREARMLVYNEAMFSANTTTDIIVRECKRLETELFWYNRTPERWADIPGQLQVDMINGAGYFVRVPHKDDRDAAINALRLQIIQGKVLIHPRCVNLIQCLKTARYDDKRRDFVRTEMFGHADILMALVYANRMLDRSTNPYPAVHLNRDHQIYTPRRTQETPIHSVARELAPYDPRKRAGKVG